MRAKARFFKTSVLVPTLVVVLIGLHYGGMLAPLENLVIKISAYPQSLLAQAGMRTGNALATNKTYAEIVNDNKQLHQQISQLLVENSKLKSTIDQNELAQKHFDFLENLNYAAITARIIGFDPVNDRNIIIIDKGREDGLVENLPVIVDQGILIGKTFQVEQEFSRILLVTDSLSQISAKLENEAATNGIVTGEHGLTMKMELIPQEITLRENQTVVTAGVEDTIPAGLIIGRVNRIEKELNNFFQTAYLQSIVPLREVNFVSILLP